jgi:hypothetical protein
MTATAQTIAAQLRQQAQQLIAMADALERSRIMPAPEPRTVAPDVLRAVLATIERQPGMNARALRDAVKGCSHADVDAAALQLQQAGQIEDLGAGRARAWHATHRNASHNGTGKTAPTARVTVATAAESDDRAETPQPTENPTQRTRPDVRHRQRPDDERDSAQEDADAGVCARGEVDDAPEGLEVRA